MSGAGIVQRESTLPSTFTHVDFGSDFGSNGCLETAKGFRQGVETPCSLWRQRHSR